MQAPLTCCGGQSLSDLGCKNNPAKQLDAGGSRLDTAFPHDQESSRPTLTWMPSGIGISTGWLKPKFSTSVFPFTVALYPTPMSCSSLVHPSETPITMLFASALQQAEQCLSV